MSKVKLAIGVVLVAIVIAIAYFLGHSSSVQLGTINGTDITATRFTQLLVDNGIQVTANGINNVSGCTTAAGVTTCTLRQAIVSGTSTPCAILNPFTGTSTVLASSMNITTATSSAITWAVGTSTTAFATSTSMLTQSIAASAQATLSYAPLGGNTISGSNYVLYGSGAGTTAGTGAFNPGIVISGTCQATFQTAN